MLIFISPAAKNISKETAMKQLLTRHIVAIVVTLSGSSAYAGNVGVDLNIHLGDLFRTVSVREPVYAPPVQVYAPPVRVYGPPVEEHPIGENVRFIYPDALGFYVAVGVPYDLCYMQNSYYLFRDGRWLRSPSSRGPWVVQSYRDLPQGLRSQRIERIRDYRYAGQRGSGRYQDRYSGRNFRPGAREQRSDEREQWREAREERGQRQEDYREGRRTQVGWNR
jgi:hypothetical protein